MPIVEQLAAAPGSVENLNLLISYIPKYCKRDIRHEFKDVALNHIKLLGIVAVKAKSVLRDLAYPEGQAYIQYMITRINSFLKDKFSVYVKKEVFNLISLVADLPVKDGLSKHRRDQRSSVLDCIEPSLNYVKKLHFPVKTADLRPQSNEA